MFFFNSGGFVLYCHFPNVDVFAASSIGVGCLSAVSAILFYDDILRLNFALIFCVDILR